MKEPPTDRGCLSPADDDQLCTLLENAIAELRTVVKRLDAIDAALEQKLRVPEETK